MKRVFTFDEVADLLLYALVAKGECSSKTTYSIGAQVNPQTQSIEFSVSDSKVPVVPEKKVDDFGDEIEEVDLDDD